MPEATVVEIGGRSDLCGITTGVLSAAFVCSSVPKVVLVRMKRAILKLTITIVKDVASVPVNAGHRQ